MIGNIPQELRLLPQWVSVDMTIDKKTGKPKKHPHHPRTGAFASVDDPDTWGTFDDAVKRGGTIGFVLTTSDPYTIIDLDNKLDNPATEEELERHGRILECFDSYTERSVSGRGYHIIVKGNIPSGVNRSKVEVYSDGRYMIMTGDVVRAAEINEYQDYLMEMWEGMKSHSSSVELEHHDAIMSDADLIEMAMRAENADKFNALCGGDWVGMGYSSQSEADLALLSIYAFYSKDNEQVKRLFRMGPLGHREKAMKNDVYLNFTLRKIRANEPPPVDFTAIAENAARIAGQAPPPANAPAEEAKPIHEPYAKPEAPSEFSLPPGFIGELTKYYYSTAARPVMEVALAAAIATVAGTVGRAYSISNTGLNQYMILIAKTGSGKEGAASGMSNLFSAARQLIPMIDTFKGPSTFASGQAVLRKVSKHPCFVSVLGEFGLTLQQWCHPRASAPDKMTKKVMLDLYGKSGPSQYIDEMVYSDTEKNTNSVRAPNVTILGETTPESLFDGLDGSHIAEGLIPRFLMIEYTGERPSLNEQAGFPPHEELVKAFADLATISLTTSNNNTFCPVATDQDGKRVLTAFDKEADDHMRGNKADVQLQLWNRAHLKALKLAALLAVGVNPHGPVITVDEAEWAVAFVKKDIALVSYRFSTGDIGIGDSKQAQDLKRAIDSYYKADKKSLMGKYLTPSNLIDAKLVPYSYLIKRTAALASYRQDKMGSTIALQRALKSMCDSGVLREIPRQVLNEKFKFSGAAYGLEATYE